MSSRVAGWLGNGVLRWFGGFQAITGWLSSRARSSAVLRAGCACAVQSLSQAIRPVYIHREKVVGAHKDLTNTLSKTF